MGIAVLVARFALMAMNAAFVICGLALILVGVFVRYAGDTVLSFLTPVLTQIRFVTGDASISLDTSSTGFDIVSILQNNSVVFIAVGTVLGAIAIFGCIGACFSVRILLLVYGVLMCVIVFAQIVGIAVVAGNFDTYKASVITFINDTAKTEYKGTTATNAFSLIVNVVQMNFNCCGVESSTDFFYGATNWNKSAHIVITEQSNTAVMATPFEIPVACCMKKEAYPSLNVIDLNCAKTPTSTNSYISEGGCVTKIIDYIITYETWVIVAVSCLEILQVVIIVVTFLIWKSMGDGKVGAK